MKRVSERRGTDDAWREAAARWPLVRRHQSPPALFPALILPAPALAIPLRAPARSIFAATMIFKKDLDFFSKNISPVDGLLAFPRNLEGSITLTSIRIRHVG